VLGDAAEPTADHIPQLAYIEACFREALRLHPPVGAVSRDATVDTIIKVGHGFGYWFWLWFWVLDLGLGCGFGFGFGFSFGFRFWFWL